jgi:hypothetical protein
MAGLLLPCGFFITMRPKIAAWIVGGALVLIASLMILRPKNAGQGSASLSEDGPGGVIVGSASGGQVAGSLADPPQQSPAPPPRLPNRSAKRVYAGGPNEPANASVRARLLAGGLSPEEREDLINERIREISDLSSESDPDATTQLLAELTNGIPELRKAALEAVMQAGNADAIPHLKELADSSQDPKEKKELREAMDFLKLPSLAEVSASLKSVNAGKSPPVRSDYPARSTDAPR